MNTMNPEGVMSIEKLNSGRDATGPAKITIRTAEDILKHELQAGVTRAGTLGRSGVAS
jgi:hypothetical protein